ncbi:cysteine desufuration protein SufE [Agaricicola taiwanensis]|uniref:Cysteine desufuration protein SufE n=1 Tax=Agaricicola taiwanensis TaxID=591372 RepID=A0A8J2VP63_9RHOB|nr:SufE family protein [Agaricicola taiwanensis]GGE36895.1 cysteine desufuration protein SufE [Agaricicola taiwanensis]
MTLDEIIDGFEFLDDWEDRYRFLIELGRTLEPLSDDERNAATKVEGCASQVWLVSQTQRGADGSPRLTFRGDSDAHLVRGLIAILIALYSGRSAQEIAQTDAQALLDRFGLGTHLTPQRSNGVRAMVNRIRSEAARILASA